MDNKDKVILETLLADASRSIASIADHTGLPATTVYHRIKKLKAQHIIHHYTIKIDRSHIFGEIFGYILITTSQTANQREILRTLASKPNILDAAIITGDSDILIKLQVASIQELDQFILDELRHIDGIVDSKTMIGLENQETLSLLPESRFKD